MGHSLRYFGDAGRSCSVAAIAHGWNNFRDSMSRGGSLHLRSIPVFAHLKSLIYPAPDLTTKRRIYAAMPNVDLIDTLSREVIDELGCQIIESASSTLMTHASCHIASCGLFTILLHSLARNVISSSACTGCRLTG